MKKETFTTSDFAHFARTTRATLLHYDRIGLLSPALRTESKYRHYSVGQLATINLIRTCQALGMTLEEIKELKDRRSPRLADEVLGRELQKIDEKIDEWVRARKLLNVLRGSILGAINVDTEAITTQFLPAEAIVLGDLNDYSRGRNDYDALLSFYHWCSEKYPDMDLNYSVWAMFSEERIKRRDWTWPDRYYFYNPDGLDKKPAALYAIGYKHGGYGQSTSLYERMHDYIDANGLEICGPTFEEYPLNEICVLEDKDYLMRVMITVREKQ